MNKENNILKYENQLEFKAWALAQLGSHKNDDLFYFDYITGVDSMHDSDIPKLVADGSLSWSNGLEIIKNYFKMN